MRLTLSLFALLLVVSACDEAPPDPALTTAVPEADVERFRAEIFQETIGLDAALARLEAEAAASDSVARVAYGPVLDRLRSDRRKLQVRMDSLRPAPVARFDSTRQSVRKQAERLELALGRARYDAAATYATFQTAVARGVADLEGRLNELRPYALEDTTGQLLRGIDSVLADRDRLRARVGAYPDTTESQFPPFRSSVTDRILVLNDRVTALALDTTRVALDSTASRTRTP